MEDMTVSGPQIILANSIANVPPPWSDIISSLEPFTADFFSNNEEQQNQTIELITATIGEKRTRDSFNEGNDDEDGEGEFPAKRPKNA